MSYTLDPLSEDCYPETSVLINKLGIQDQAQLDESEALITGVKALQFELSPFPGLMDFSYYKRLHGFLFGELYDWAGTVRTVNFSKQHTQFCAADNIESLAALMFARIGNINYLRGMGRQEFLVELADFYNSLNYLHPFREGNGRVQRLYFRQLARQAGYNLDFAKVDSDTMMLATIHAASGIQDTLLQVFDEMISLITDNSQ